MELAGKHYNLQIFATDIDHDAIDKARQGEYPESIAADVSPERLKQARQIKINIRYGYPICTSESACIIFNILILLCHSSRLCWFLNLSLANLPLDYCFLTRARSRL
jgi:chemotaxis methyl-accepting protein methylase